MKKSYNNFDRVPVTEIEAAIDEYNKSQSDEAYLKLDKLISSWIKEGGSLLVPIDITAVDTLMISKDDGELKSFTYTVDYVTYDDGDYIKAYTDVDEANYSGDKRMPFVLESLKFLGKAVLKDGLFSGLVINPDGDCLKLSRAYFERYIESHRDFAKGHKLAIAKPLH